jgi:hypothetical protein
MWEVLQQPPPADPKRAADYIHRKFHNNRAAAEPHAQQNQKRKILADHHLTNIPIQPVQNVLQPFLLDSYSDTIYPSNSHWLFGHLNWAFFLGSKHRANQRNL